ncbi:hypothetical protein ABHZ65_12200, partial [Bacteroides uniformis]
HIYQLCTYGIFANGIERTPVINGQYHRTIDTNRIIGHARNGCVSIVFAIDINVYLSPLLQMLFWGKPPKVPTYILGHEQQG